MEKTMDQPKFSIGPYELFSSIIVGEQQNQNK